MIRDDLQLGREEKGQEKTEVEALTEKTRTKIILNAKT